MSLDDFDNKYKNLIGNKAADRFNPNSRNYDKQTLEKLAKSYQKTFNPYPEKALGKSFNVYSEYSNVKLWLIIISLVVLGVLASIGFTLLDDPKTSDHYLYLAIMVICWVSLVSFIFTLYDNIRAFNILLYSTIVVLSVILYTQIDQNDHNGISIAIIAIASLITLILLFYYNYPEPGYNSELERYRTKEERDRKLKNLANYVRKEQDKAVAENEKKWKKLKLNKKEIDEVKEKAIADVISETK